MHNEKPYIYDPKNVNVIVNGRVLMNFASDKVISISKNEDNIIPNKGCKGDVVYAANADDTAIAEVVLQSSSSSLGYLRELAETRKLCHLTIVDVNNDGAFVVDCDYCAILKAPDIERGKEASNTTVQFYIPYLEPRVPAIQ